MFKKSILTALLVSFSLCILALASCGGKGNAWKYDETYHWHEADGEITEKAEHVPSEWIVTAEATTETSGSKHIVCTVCNAELQVEEIAKIDENRPGSGTWEDPYNIRTYEDLHSLRQKDAEGVYFKLLNDIDLEGVTLQPYEDFYGNFDGGNHYIYNFSIVYGVYPEIGLFRKNHGSIANLKLSALGEGKCYIGVIPDRQTVSCGALVGDNFGNVYNCSVENAEIRVNSSYNTGSDGATTINIGGLIGKVSGGEVKGCYAVNNIVYGNAKNESGTESSFSACVYAGGLIGSSDSSVSHCYAYGNSLEANAYAYYKTSGYTYYYGKTYEQLGGVIGKVNGSTVIALIGYENEFKVTYTSGAGSLSSYYGSYSYNFGEAVGYNSGTLQYVYGKTSDSTSVAGYAGTSYYCEQIDISNFNKLPIISGEGIWGLDVKTVEVEG
ncbi:MAG: hypothetical protein J5836_01725, partial [Clostridia bacterium]|nr:hypothetical protein [Clostridia bacterium]